MRTTALIAALATSTCIVSLATPAQAQQTSFNIPAGSLKSALIAYGRQSGHPIVYKADEVRSVRSPGYRGTASPDAALAAILSHTGFAAREGTSGSVAIVQVGNGQGTAGDPQSSFRKAAAFSSENEEADIVVTAQKREETLDKVPISITALSGKTLDSSTAEGVSEALRSVPGVTTSQYFQGGGTNVTIRGVSASAPVLNGSGPVGYYLDTVPFGFVKSAIAPDSSAFDLQRVEVLRGPQGTLYGASALNGVVRVLTNDADLSSIGFKARSSGSYTEGGSFNYRVDGMVNLPIVEDRLGVRLVAGYTDNDGWIDRPGKVDANNARMFTLRAKVNAAPTDNLKIAISYWRARNDYGAPSVGSKDGFRNSPVAEPMATNYDSLGGKIEYDLGGVTIANATSYLEVKNPGSFYYVNYGNNLSLYTDFRSKVFADELTISSSGNGSLTWNVGGSYRSAHDRLLQSILAIGYDYDARDNSDAVAVFGEATQSFGRFKITGGLRYFHDTVSASDNYAPDPAHAAFHAVTPRAVLAWLPSDRTMAYLSYSQGFRSGALQYQGLVPSGFPTLKPDRLTNYEAGVKTGLFGDRVRLEGAVYYIDWKNVQQSLIVLADTGTYVTALVNGDGASGLGLDGKIAMELLPNLNMSVNANWNDLRMDADVLSSGVVLFHKGDRLNMSPATTIGGSADYGFSISDRKANVSGSLAYTSSQSYRTVTGGARYVSNGDPQLVVGARFSIEATDKLRATLFVNNLTNENRSIYSSPYAGRNLSDWDARIRPRTFGIQFEYR